MAYKVNSYPGKEASVEEVSDAAETSSLEFGEVFKNVQNNTYQVSFRLADNEDVWVDFVYSPANDLDALDFREAIVHYKDEVFTVEDPESPEFKQSLADLGVDHEGFLNAGQEGYDRIEDFQGTQESPAEPVGESLSFEKAVREILGNG